jgi:uncharacterized protein (DUF1778 family)
MSEELKEEKVEEKKEEKKEELPQFSEVEEEAMEQGWQPKEQWVADGKNPDEWRSAKEFKERGEFFSTIHQLKRDNKSQAAALDSMKRHHQFVFDQAYRKAQADLRKERRMALKDEDIDRVEELETELERLNTEYTTQKQEIAKVEVQPAAAPELAAFVGRNPWYETDSELRDEADAVGLVFANRHPGSRPEVILTHVETTIKKRHPDKFGTRRTAPNAVSSVDRTRSSRKSEPDYELDELETKVMNDLVRAGVMTKAEYVADLKKIKGEK